MSVPRRFNRAVAGTLAAAAIAAPVADARPALEPGDPTGPNPHAIVDSGGETAVTRTTDPGFDWGSAAIGAGGAAALLLLVGAGNSVRLHRPRHAGTLR